MPTDAIRVKSKAQAVYELLRQRILDFHYEPGQPLSIDGLARELGVSKIPIREAIKQLQAERLVDTVLHVGARIAPITLAQAEQIYLFATPSAISACASPSSGWTTPRSTSWKRSSARWRRRPASATPPRSTA